MRDTSPTLMPPLSCNRLSARTIAHPSVLLSFDKDDDDTLDFVLATANLRAIAYGIPTKTRFQVKGELHGTDRGLPADPSCIHRNGREYHPRHRHH